MTNTMHNAHSSQTYGLYNRDNKLTADDLMKNELARKGHILVVDDEEDILELVRFNLAKEGFKISTVDTGEKALAEIKITKPDVIILDLMLPGVDGLEVCKTLKSAPETSHIPILMLTAKSEEADVVTGLELGADDYMTKPFSPRVLLARIKAILRKKKTATQEKDTVIHIGDMAIHPSQHEVVISDKTVDLTVTEFRILLTLVRRPGWVFNRDQIVDASRGTNAIVTTRSVDVHIVSLRRKLGDYGNYIETVRGLGYRFTNPQED